MSSSFIPYSLINLFLFKWRDSGCYYTVQTILELYLKSFYKIMENLLFDLWSFFCLSQFLHNNDNRVVEEQFGLNIYFSSI